MQLARLFEAESRKDARIDLREQRIDARLGQSAGIRGDARRLRRARERR